MDVDPLPKQNHERITRLYSPKSPITSKMMRSSRGGCTTRTLALVVLALSLISLLVTIPLAMRRSSVPVPESGRIFSVSEGVSDYSDQRNKQNLPPLAAMRSVNASDRLSEGGDDERDIAANGRLSEGVADDDDQRSKLTSPPPSPSELNVFIADYRARDPALLLLENVLYKRGGLRLNLTMGCTQNQPYGVGNALTRIFTTRLLALATNSTFSFHCNDLPLGVDDLCSLPDGTPCLLTQFETDSSTPESREVLLPHTLPDDVFSLIHACLGRFPHKLPHCLGNYSQPIVRDIRMIAKRAETDHGIQPDDVVIHFRCGDALGFGGASNGFAGEGGSGYGLVPHGYYVDRIINDTDNVGNISIVTQPFDRKHMRNLDGMYGKQCKVIVEDLQLYLKVKFPKADVHIRNRPEKGETSYSAFVRLVLARKAAFCGPSTFCTSAVLSTFADKGYIFAKEPWVRSAVEIYDHIEFVKGGPIIRPKGMDVNTLLSKLRNTKFEVVA